MAKSNQPTKSKTVPKGGGGKANGLLIMIGGLPKPPKSGRKPKPPSSFPKAK